MSYSVVLVPVDGKDAAPTIRIDVSKAPVRHTIGRLMTCDTVINMPLISAVHATLTVNVDGGGKPVMSVTDNSSNGNWVNGVRLARGETKPLHDTDVLQICKAADAPHIKYRVAVRAPGEEVDENAAAAPSLYSLNTLLPADQSQSVIIDATDPSATPTGAGAGATSAKSKGGRQQQDTAGLPQGPRDIHSVTRVGNIHTDYEIIEQLGDGAFSVVYKARRRDDKKPEYVAVKRIDISKTHSSAANHKTGVNPLEEEIRILAKLDNPHIVKLLEVVKEPSATPKYLYIVQELVTGGELFNKVVGKGSFEESQARGLFRQLLRGVAYLHDMGVVHRDLKPENVLLQPYLLHGGSAAEEKRYVVKITDFGMARMADSAGLNPGGIGVSTAASATLNRMSTLVGTVNYLSVELFCKYAKQAVDDVKGKVKTTVQRALGLRTAAPGSVRSRDALDSYITGIAAGAFNNDTLPAGYHYYPTDEDYAAIEDALRRGYGETVDSWSLGIILYICLSGSMPFWDEPGVRPPMLIQMCTQYIDLESEVWTKISAEARDLVQQLLHPNPVKRITPKQALQHPWFRGAISSAAPDGLRAGTGADAAAEVAERLAAEAAQAEELEEPACGDALERSHTESTTGEEAAIQFRDDSMGRPEYTSRAKRPRTQAASRN